MSQIWPVFNDPYTYQPAQKTSMGNCRCTHNDELFIFFDGSLLLWKEPDQVVKIFFPSTLHTEAPCLLWASNSYLQQNEIILNFVYLDFKLKKEKKNYK